MLVVYIYEIAKKIKKIKKYTVFLKSYICAPLSFQRSIQAILPLFKEKIFGGTVPFTRKLKNKRRKTKKLGRYFFSLYSILFGLVVFIYFTLKLHCHNDFVFLCPST